MKWIALAAGLLVALIIVAGVGIAIAIKFGVDNQTTNRNSSTFNSGSRTMTMMQTEVLSGEGWSLGENVGKLSADGKRISGTGKDAMGASLGMTYQWSFTRK